MGAHVWWPVVPQAPLVRAVPALGLVAGLVRRVPGRALLLPVPGGADRARSTRSRSSRTTSRSSSSRSPGRCCSRRARTRSPAGCGRRGPRRRRSRSRRPGCSCRPATTGRSTAATSRARSRASSRSRSRSRSACSRWARSAKTLDTGQAAVAAGGADRGVGDVARRRRDGPRAVRARCSSLTRRPASHVAARVADRRRRRRAHRGVVAAADRAHTT